MDEKELMNLFNNKTRRKSSISMLFNNNYFYQTDPELSSNLEFMHNKPPNFLDEQSNNYPPILQSNGMYNGYVPPPPPYYYGNYPPPFSSNHGFNYGYEPSNNQHGNNEDYQDKTTNVEEKVSLKTTTKPVIENQQVLWNNAMENVDVIDQYLRSMEKS